MEKRKDGFHDIKSIMHTVSLCDTISAERLVSADEQNIILEVNGNIPCRDKNNLVWRAAEKFFEFYNIKDYRVYIKIDKNIPVAAGLAGGSSDAGTAIKILDKLYDTGASVHDLCEIGSSIGSDVPFCITGGTCITTGRGEIVTPINTKVKLKFIIANGGEGISTPAAYKMADDIYKDILSKDFGYIDKIKLALENNDIENLAKYSYNAFEKVIFQVHKEAEAARNIMLDNGAIRAMLCGSGPSVFGIFNNDSLLKKAFYTLKNFGYKVFACETQMKA